MTSIGLENSRAKWSYIIGLIAIFGSVYFQYLGIDYGQIPGFLVVYGVPIVVITLLWKTTIVSRFFDRSLPALKIGMGYFGAFTLLSIIVSFVILIVLFLFDPDTVNLLDKPNPVLNVPPSLAWAMVAVSLLIVGPAEEYIFRGFVFGGLLVLFKSRHWLSFAFVSSILFAVTHLYYAFTYGIASLIPFTDLVTFGMALAITYYVSGGNLFAPSLIHGAYNATAFVGVATTQDIGTFLRWLMIIIGLVAGLVLLLERVRKKSARLPWQSTSQPDNTPHESNGSEEQKLDQEYPEYTSRDYALERALSQHLHSIRYLYFCNTKKRALVCMLPLKALFMKRFLRHMSLTFQCARILLVQCYKRASSVKEILHQARAQMMRRGNWLTLL